MKIILICGESYLLINEEIEKNTKNSKNIVTFDLGECSLEDVLIEAGYVSMFDEEKYIIVKNANFFGSEKIKEENVELLMNYMEHPNSNTTIIFVLNGKADTRKKVTKLIKDNFCLISIPNLKYYEVENRIMDYFKKNNFKIDLESIKYIVASSLNNYDIAYMESSKLMLYYNDSNNIKLDDVKKIVSHSINSNNFLFVDAVVDNDLEKSLEYYNDLKTLKIEPSVLISLLARDFRIMLQVKTMLEDNKREYEILNVLGLQDWQLDKYIKKTLAYKKCELEKVILKLADLDLNMKSGKIDRFIGLELFILDICG